MAEYLDRVQLGGHIRRSLDRGKPMVPGIIERVCPWCRRRHDFTVTTLPAHLAPTVILRQICSDCREVGHSPIPGPSLWRRVLASDALVNVTIAVILAAPLWAPWVAHWTGNL